VSSYDMFQVQWSDTPAYMRCDFSLSDRTGPLAFDEIILHESTDLSMLRFLLPSVRTVRLMVHSTSRLNHFLSLLQPYSNLQHLIYFPFNHPHVTMPQIRKVGLYRILHSDEQNDVNIHASFPHLSLVYRIDVWMYLARSCPDMDTVHVFYL